jgi:hypothetical protein
MAVDSPEANEELAGDFSIGSPCGDMLEHVKLAVGEHAAALIMWGAWDGSGQFIRDRDRCRQLDYFLK